MTQKYAAWYRISGILLDLFLLNLSGFIAYIYIYHSIHYVGSAHLNMLHILVINFVWFNVTQLTRLYQNMFIKDAIPTVKEALGSLLLFAGFIVFLLLVLDELNLSHKLIYLTMAIFTPIFFAFKIGFLLLRRSHRAKMVNYTRVVIVGAGPVGKELYTLMHSKLHSGYRVVGFFDDKASGEIGDASILGRVDEVMAFVKRYKIKDIYCALPDRAIDKINKLMREADQALIRFKLVPDVKDYFKKNVNVQMMGHLPVISSRTEPLEIPGNQLLKRAFDVVFSLFVIICVMSWLLPIIAILIKLESKGPVFFMQIRSGKDNKPFYCFKFRSMRTNSDSDKLQATKNDSRITKLGAFMRKTSIDELPQFFNVLRGEMSVVGPRPHMLQHTSQYSAIIDQFMVRHLVLPGITGWAQVSGHRGETNAEGSMEARVKADIWYLENWSLFLDLKIAFLTVWQVIAGHENAY
ncbi:undecaprenyl-phosphate glucose phosphotransferase [Pedobacter duraquae]|uniref:Undecaprenyl-phosphate galactose phosphotransferase/putative colanic acid biosynthesis UDP-glucose lipid carrier transferase n=1 Tax=Pedobacter duraquae TaxID=425511 RepID=A0A4R6IBW0_9SPHI|nr:undecaprenyl-phosphate glucose phosphotransferase [Pedobacter duraquae]TDO19037.1 undecaprenyl-phosphate galactose phosphotransferase/putative colanic acid biosynthesis UDP-glucose lipid carrier transferase [Pedobacter duraquae]